MAKVLDRPLSLTYTRGMRWKEQGRALREWRQSEGLTQRALGEAVGLPRSQISMMELGEVRAGVDYLFRIERMGGPAAECWTSEAAGREAVPA